LHTPKKYPCIHYIREQKKKKRESSIPTNRLIPFKAVLLARMGLAPVGALATTVVFGVDLGYECNLFSVNW
jgi:hypothetical protein